MFTIDCIEQVYAQPFEPISANTGSDGVSFTLQVRVPGNYR